MADNQGSPLLRLPPELRIMVYGHIFTSLPHEYCNTRDFRDLEPTYLFQINREIRTEAGPEHKMWLSKGTLQLLYENPSPLHVNHYSGPDLAKQNQYVVDTLKAQLHDLQHRIKALDLAALLRQRAGNRMDVVERAK